MILSLFLAIIIAIIGIFLISDCDLFLQYAPYDEKNAFENQIVWILGASSGIGAYLAIDLTKAGAQVIISARRENLLHEVAENCTKYGKTPMIVPIDILDYDSHEIAYNEIISKYGRIDSLVLNSGRSQRAVALETTLSVTKDIMELNFLSFVAITKLVVPDMVKAKKGQVIVVSSLAGKLGNPISSSYAASKHALHGYYDSLRAELSDDNVQVSLVCPGPVVSEITDKVFRAEGDTTAPVHEKDKMTTERCSYLIAKGMYHKVDEMWISKQPFLSFVYIGQYAPWFYRQMLKLAGPVRVRQLKAGGDVYDLNALFRAKK